MSIHYLGELTCIMIYEDQRQKIPKRKSKVFDTKTTNLVQKSLVHEEA